MAEFSLERAVEEGLEEVLRLTLRLALLDAQSLEFVDDVAWAMRLIYEFLLVHWDSLLRKA